MRRLRLCRGQSAAEFMLILPVAALFMCGIVQFSLICVNALLVKYAAYTVARACVSYVEPWKSSQTAEQANYTVKQLLYGMNTFSVSSRKAVDFITPKNPKDAGLSVTDVTFPDSPFVYKKVTVSYDMELEVPFANRAVAAIFNSTKNGKYYFPLKATAIMQSAVRK